MEHIISIIEESYSIKPKLMRTSHVIIMLIVYLLRDVFRCCKGDSYNRSKYLNIHINYMTSKSNCSCHFIFSNNKDKNICFE